jgi:hypothetical protein
MIPGRVILQEINTRRTARDKLLRSERSKAAVRKRWKRASPKAERKQADDEIAAYLARTPTPPMFFD